MMDYQLWPSLVVGLPFAVIIGCCIWREYFSPLARAKSRAYDLGFDRGLDGATVHDSPFESAALSRSFTDGVEDARLSLRRKREKSALERDRATLGTPRRPG